MINNKYILAIHVTCMYTIDEQKDTDSLVDNLKIILVWRVRIADNYIVICYANKINHKF